MSRDVDRRKSCHFVNCLPSETLARVVEIGLWPTRGFLRSIIGYHEWFDWSELFAEGAAETLLSISRKFSSSAIRIACLQTDAPIEESPSIRVVELSSEELPSCYFDAIWDERSTSISVALAVAARIVLVWDVAENWIIVNDRFLEIGLFASLDSKGASSNGPFFHSLAEQDLLDRLSTILRIGKVAALSEVRRWSESA